VPAFVPDKTLVHVAGQCFDGLEANALVELAQQNRLQVTAGWRHAQLERALAKDFGVDHAILTNSGSSANLLAVAALPWNEWPYGSEVITVACAFPTTVAPIVQCGGTPVFVDVGPDGNVDPERIEDAITGKTRAIVLAHALGFPFDLEAVTALCKRYGLRLVEDCCDAFGATWHGRRVGTFGDAATLSFYPAHHMTTGEGGCVLTNDARIAKTARSLRDWGKDCYCPPDHDNTCGRRFDQPAMAGLPAGWDHKYTFSHLGYNLKMTEMQAAIGLVQFMKVNGFIERRRETWRYYREQLEGLGVDFTVPHREANPSPFGFMIRTRARDQLVRALEARRIQTRPLFAGNLLRHPAMHGVSHGVVGGLAKTDRLMAEAFWVGVYPGVTDEMREFVVRTIREEARR
jgi:CDP-6-deoxy-D-xylo-4-hexulose-3-dehydrase